jgi:predicted RNA-binding protein with PIN domain
MNEEHIIIDGYNAIFRHPALRAVAAADLERARTELARRIAEAFPGHTTLLVIVFDGHRDVALAGRTRRFGRVRVIFSRPPESADQRIQKLIEEARRVKQGRRRLDFRVVSSDREVSGRARLWGARAVSSDEFLKEVEERRGVAARTREAATARQPAHEPRVAKDGTLDVIPTPSEVDQWEKLFRTRSPRPEDDEEDAG